MAIAVAVAAATGCAIDSAAGVREVRPAALVTTPQPEPLPVATPVVAIDDTRAHAPSAPDYASVSVDGRWLVGDDGRVEELTSQLALGVPRLRDRDANDILSVFRPYALRVRTTTIHADDGWHQGPLSLGVQRFVPIDHVSFLPLADAHFGVEAVVSTPWLSDRHAVPAAAIQHVDAVDSELAQNGWSLRPASAHVRADFLACRSAFAELGAAPELFVPAAGPDEYAARAHVAVGWGLGCADRVSAHPAKLSLAYRARVRLHAGDAPARYRDALGAALQYDAGRFLVQVVAATTPADRIGAQWSLGLRVQVGALHPEAP